MAKTPKRPRDPNQLAAHIVGIASGEIEDHGPSERGRAGGLKGGAARAEKLSPERRAEIAQRARDSRGQKES